jgi:DNA gyrase/topoisomerase IV subunit A
MATRKSKTKEQLSLTSPPPTIPDVEQQPVAVFARKAYLDYSMYVVLDRAAAHRRRTEAGAAAIVYAMSN